MVKKKIIVFGGCFNPPLNSHFSLAEQIVSEYEDIEKLMLIAKKKIRSGELQK